MMLAWIFTHPDTWTRTDAPEWGESEEVDAFMARLGYTPHSHARNSDLVNFVGSWMLYTAIAPDAEYGHALLVDGAQEACVFVWVPTLPDLLAYMAHYGELGQAAWNQMEWDEIRDTIRRFFRVSHGHGAETFCRECDPLAYETWQRKQAEKRAKKAQGVGVGSL